MKLNIGTVDQMLRLSIGFVLVFMAGTKVIGAWGYVGAVLMATAALRFCPLYSLLGFSTSRRKRR